MCGGVGMDNIDWDKLLGVSDEQIGFQALYDFYQNLIKVGFQNEEALYIIVGLIKGGRDK